LGILISQDRVDIYHLKAASSSFSGDLTIWCYSMF